MQIGNGAGDISRVSFKDVLARGTRRGVRNDHMITVDIGRKVIMLDAKKFNTPLGMKDVILTIGENTKDDADYMAALCGLYMYFQARIVQEDNSGSIKPSVEETASRRERRNCIISEIKNKMSVPRAQQAWVAFVEDCFIGDEVDVSAWIFYRSTCLGDVVNKLSPDVQRKIRQFEKD